MDLKLRTWTVRYEVRLNPVLKGEIIKPNLRQALEEALSLVKIYYRKIAPQYLGEENEI